MALKTFRPVTPTLRHTVLIDHSELWKGDPVKALSVGKREQGGRNNLGRITQRWRGGGHKKRYRLVDFKRTKWDVPAEVVRLEYDPNRSGFIALIKYADGQLSYILAPQRLKAGDKVVSGDHVDVKPGNAMPMRNIPVGTIIHNVEMKPGKGAQLARSAGTFVQLVGRDAGYALLRLASGEVRKVRACPRPTTGISAWDWGRPPPPGRCGCRRWAMWPWPGRASSPRPRPGCCGSWVAASWACPPCRRSSPP